MGRRSFSDNRTSKSGESDSPYSMVRAVVPPRDDRQAPSLTFRSILLGVFFSSALAFVNQLLWFKATPIAIGGFAVQILSFPCGYLLAKILPPTEFTTFGYKWSLNPGPFSIKE
ncbi:OPT-domain-containing protein, partial [Martensiomyces pterosporus]